MIWCWTRRLTWRSTRWLTQRWPTLSTSWWFRSFGYLWGKCWQTQILCKNVLMPEEFEGPYGYYTLEKNLLHFKLRHNFKQRALVLSQSSRWTTLKLTFTEQTKLLHCKALMQKFLMQLAKRMKEDLDVRWSKIWNGERILEHCVTLHSKDTNDWQKIFHMWNMWKGIHSSFKPAQAYRHRHGEKPLIGPNLC